MPDFDPWNDDWSSAPNTPTSSNPSVLIVDSKSKVESLFQGSSSERLVSYHSTDSQSGPTTPTYEVQTSSQGTHFKPQLKILKRAPRSDDIKPVGSEHLSQKTTIESEDVRLQKVKRDKEAKYQAARDRVFGPSTLPTQSSTPASITKSAKSNTSMDTLERADATDNPRKQQAHQQHRSRQNQINTGVLRQPKGPDGSPGFRQPSRKM
ncbi:uncharacterized protein V1516DRAFT_543654 [Lipomyces oligophaga]|uniref:uncharacterized protein n=1 Tax=Lipomyces oligophaga TaxID=45792 RepID=UPI0034CD5E04